MSLLQMRSMAGDPTFQCLPETSQGVCTQPANLGIEAVDCGEISGFNCKVWDSSFMLELWDSNVGFTRPWSLLLQWLLFVLWCSQVLVKNFSKILFGLAFPFERKRSPKNMD